MLNNWTTDADTTLFAQWNIQTREIQVVYSGASVSNATTLTVAMGENSFTLNNVSDNNKFIVNYSNQSVEITIQTQAGYNYRIKNGSNVTSVTDGSLNTLTYSWTPTDNATLNIYVGQVYAVTFDLAGGNAGAGGTTANKLHDVALNVSNYKPTKNGYTFNGWMNGETLIQPTGAYTGNADATLVAQWELTPYIIHYSLGDYADAQFVNSATANFAYNFSTDLTLYGNNEVFRPGYTLTGWTFDHADGGYNTSWGTTSLSAEYHFGTGLYGDVYLVANWSLETYTITYVDKSGNNENATDDYTINDKFNLLGSADMSRIGYTLAGWNVGTGDTRNNWAVDNGATRDYTQGVEVSGKYGNVTLVADWSLVEYHITYNLAGGNFINSNEENPQSYVYTDAVALKGRANIQRAGYELVGYSISATGTNNWTTTYPDGITLNEDGSFTTPINMFGDITLTAQWNAVATNYDVIVMIQTAEEGAYAELGRYSDASLTTGSTISIEDVVEYINSASSGLNVNGFEYAGRYETNQTGNSLVIVGDGSLDITVYYDTIQYTLTYSANNGTFAEGVQTSLTYDVYDTINVLTREQLTRTGYRLMNFTVSGAGNGSSWPATVNPETSIFGNFIMLNNYKLY